MKKNSFNAPLGASLVVLSSLFYATYGVWVTLMGDYFGAFTQATVRHFLVVLLLLAIVIGFRQTQRIHWRRDAKWFALSAGSSAVVPASMYYAFLNAGVGITSALLYIGIVLGMFFFGWMFAKERYTKDKWLATALGMLGIALVFGPNLGTAGLLSMSLAFISGFAGGLNVVASKKMPYNASQTALIAWSLGMLANLPFIFIFSERLDVFHWDVAWLYMGIFAFMCVGASWLVIRGVKLIEAGAAGILGLLEIVFGVLFGIAFFSEKPGPVVVLGMVVIVIAASIPYIKDYNAKRGTLEGS